MSAYYDWIQTRDWLNALSEKQQFMNGSESRFVSEMCTKFDMYNTPFLSQRQLDWIISLIEQYVLNLNNDDRLPKPRKFRRW